VIYLYWILAVPTGVLAGLVILLTLSGRSLSSSTPDWLAILTAAIVLALLGWGYNLGTSEGKPGLAALLVVVSWIVFFATMLVNGLLHQKTWN
jgi:hypothetical protein